MTIPQRLRALFVCGMLEFAALTRIPMRPEQIEELMQTMNRPKLAHVMPKESSKEDGERRFRK
jgi:hypothetical protein